MATSGQLSRSVAGASDENFEFSCSPCEHNSKVMEAEVYCEECSKYLCRQCLEFHNDYENTKVHRLVDKDGMKALGHRRPRQLSLDVTGASDEYFEFTCSPCKHDPKVSEAEVYCEDCSEFLCRKCLEFHNKFEKMKVHRMVDKSDMKSHDQRTPLSVPTMRKIKCVVVGDGAVGKTYIIISYQENRFAGDVVILTVHNEIVLTVSIGGETYTLDVHDNAGQEDFDRLRTLVYPQTDVILVCFSIISPSSIENVREKWYPEIKHHCPGVPFLLVGCKADLRDDVEANQRLTKNKLKPVSLANASLLARELGAVKYVECSAKTHEGVKNVFEEAVLAVLNSELHSPEQERKKCSIS